MYDPNYKYNKLIQFHSYVFFKKTCSSLNIFIFNFYFCTGQVGGWVMPLDGLLIFFNFFLLNAPPPPQDLKK